MTAIEHHDGHEDTALSRADLLRLQEKPHPQTRASIAKKVCVHLEREQQQSKEYLLASEIAKILQKDVHPIVRITLAEGLKHSPHAPRELILMLAHDEDASVAEPVLRHSEVLDEGDLLSLIDATREVIRLIAVAERKMVTSNVCMALIEKDMPSVVVALSKNTGADISEEGYIRITEKYFSHQDIFTSLMQRSPMPSQAIKDMISKAEVKARSNIQFKKTVRVQSFMELTDDSIYADIAMLLSLGSNPDKETCSQIVEKLNLEGRINAPVMLLALCLGQRSFFAACMAKHTGVRYEQVLKSISRTEDDFRKLYNNSRLSSVLYRLFWWTLKHCNDALDEGIEPGSESFLLVMSSNILAAEQHGINFSETIGRPIAEAMLSHSSEVH